LKGIKLPPSTVSEFLQIQTQHFLIITHIKFEGNICHHIMFYCYVYLNEHYTELQKQTRHV